mgnify:CR=1 FL=1
MISFCEQILLMLNVLMTSYLLFNKEFNKNHCVKGIICLFASLVVIALKKEISPSIINITFMFFAYIFIFGPSLDSIKEFISSYIVMVFFQICINSLLSFYEINNQSFISALVSLILITLLCLIIKRDCLIINNSILIILSSVCILLSAQLVLLTNLYVSMTRSMKWNIILFLITSLLFILLFYFCLKMNYEKKKEDISKQNLETIIQLQQTYLSSYTHKYQELRKFKHDYNKQILMIKDYYLNQQDQLLPYLNTLSHHLSKPNNDSQNHIINMLYQYFKEEYPQVHSSIDDQILGTITMDDSKLSSLIYNLFKNSFEASSKTTAKDVSIALKNKNSHLYIQIRNSIDQPVTLKEGYTSKDNKDDHGIGLTIIHDIVNEYHGINQYQQTENYLVNDIILFDVIH